MRATSILAVALLLAACQPDPSFPPAPTFEGGESATVVRVLDGDSLVAAVDGEQVEVRLLGLNAPEGSECHGDAAKEALEELLASGPLTLVADDENTDRFGRVLRYIYADGEDVNLGLIRSGDANVVQGDHSRSDEFTRAADEAAAAGEGMWAPTACGNGLPPSDVTITDYRYNAPGRDADNPNGEWVRISNTGREPIELSSWLLRDESTQHRYRFPNGFTLDPGADVLVRSGCGEESLRELFWCAADPVWSNGGDTVILQLADGTVVDRVRYSGDY